jgi:hypothetical protein
VLPTTPSFTEIAGGTFPHKTENEDHLSHEKLGYLPETGSGASRTRRADSMIESESSDISDSQRVSSDSSGGFSSSSGITATVEMHKRRAVDAVMAEFRSILRHGPFIGVSIRAGGGSSPDRCSATLSQSESSSRRSSNEISGGCGKRTREELQESGATGSNDSNNPKKFKSALFAERFACPFYRRNPRRHLKHRSCAGPGWPTVHRIKSVVTDCNWDRPPSS